jgi:hypothetical protein
VCSQAIDAPLVALKRPFVVEHAASRLAGGVTPDAVKDCAARAAK